MNICVFCSSSNAIPEFYFEEARKLGKLIGDHHHEIIYGGATVGLMHTVAEAAIFPDGSRTDHHPEYA